MSFLGEKTGRGKKKKQKKDSSDRFPSKTNRGKLGKKKRPYQWKKTHLNQPHLFRAKITSQGRLCALRERGRLVRWTCCLGYVGACSFLAIVACLLPCFHMCHCLACLASFSCASLPTYLSSTQAHCCTNMAIVKFTQPCYNPQEPSRQNRLKL